MDNGYKLKELRITIKLGVELIATVNNISDINKLLEDLKKESFEPTAIQKPNEELIPSSNLDHNNYEDPNSRIELNAGLEQNSLLDKKVLAFKDNVPQFLKISIFNKTTDALIVLLYAIEFGLRKKSIDYDSFKSLFDSQNIKSGSSLSMMLNNLKNSQYIDKTVYDKDRTILLTPKGSQKAVEILKSIVKS